MKYYVITALTVAFGLSLSGCGGKSAGQAAQDLKNQVTGQTNQTRNQLGLAGNWDSACNSNGIIPGFKSSKEQYHFGDDGSLTRKLYFYSDENCQMESFVRVEDGKYSTEGSSTPKEGVSVNFNFKEVSLVPSTDAGAKALNSIHFCGVTHYQTQQASNITASSTKLTCAGITKTPRDTFDTIKLLDDDRLTLGNDADETDVSKRPTQTDINKVFTRS